MATRSVLWAVVIVCIVLLSIVDESEAGRKNKQERKEGRRKHGGGGGGVRRRANKMQADLDAGWTFTDCAPKRGRTCGKGSMTGTLGDEQKTVKCKLPCPEGEEGAAGGRRGKGCRYSRGDWSECDSTTDTITRTLTLKKEREGCEQTKVQTKPCTAAQKKGKKRNACRYTKGEWSECVDGERTLSMSLSDNSDPTTCEASKVVSRPCHTKKGKSKCFYGKWTEFGECMNGVKTKTRPVIDGGERCQKKAVKTQSC